MKTSILLLTLALSSVGASPLFAEEHFRVLVFSKTAGYRHQSIEPGIAALQNLGGAHNFAVEQTEDASVFREENLSRFHAVIFLCTTGTLFTPAQRDAFQNYIRRGGGFVGIHSAADTEYDWPWYGELVGTYFRSHTAVVGAQVRVEDRLHPATRHLPARWAHTDEWYSFRANPRGQVHVLLSLDGRTLSGTEMGFDHPISWTHRFDGGRSFYTGLGHTVQAYSDPAFLAHLLGGIQWAAGHASSEGGGDASREDNFHKVVLEENVVEPMQLSVAADGRVFFVERAGAIRVWHPATSSTTTLATLAVATGHENGLLGIALDPRFAENGWIYVFYSPAGLTVQRVSRFTLSGSSLDLASEKVVLNIPTQREQCCHVGGGLAFGADGILFIGTGDNVSPFASERYSPHDERPGRAAWDAQGTSANTNDLRGKILRIRPLPDGTYVIPSGNLFPPDGSAGAPEVYVMGVRNPFRFSVDDETGWLYFGDVGPDAYAYAYSHLRGPRGYDEFNRTKHPANFGWPYFIADNKPYRRINFETGEAGEWFDPNHSINTSPNNTGNIQLPPPQPAWMWYPYFDSPEFPEIDPGARRCSMAGPVYRMSKRTAGPGSFPAYYEGVLFLYEWSRNWIKTVHFDDEGEILAMNPFLPNTSIVSPIDLEFGPDGRLYVIEWGDGFFGGNLDAQIVRIDYNPGGGDPPVAGATASVSSGPLPLQVTFSSEGSKALDGGALTYAWDLNGNGQIDSTDVAPSYTYTIAGDYHVRLTVMDTHGRTATTSVPVFAGNIRPVVRIEWPPHGSVATFGDWIGYRVSVSDAEDSLIVSNAVTVQTLLGHDDHAHPLGAYHGFSGAFSLATGGHGDSANLFSVVTARYTDKGAPGVSPLTGGDEIVLQPRRKQAQHFTRSHGLQLEPVAAHESGDVALAFINDGHWASYKPVNLVNIDHLLVRVASNSQGGWVEVRHNAPDGPLLGALHVPHTGGWQSWTTMRVDIDDPGDTHELFLVFRGDGVGLFNVNWLEFGGSGVSQHFANWAAAHGFGGHLGAPHADPGGRGVPNLARYAFALDAELPGQGAPAASWKLLQGAEPHLAITYSRPRWTTDVAYIPEVSSDLVTWTPLPAEQIAEVVDRGNGVDDIVIVDVVPRGEHPRRFFRVRLELD